MYQLCIIAWSMVYQAMTQSWPHQINLPPFNHPSNSDSCHPQSMFQFQKIPQMEFVQVSSRLLTKSDLDSHQLFPLPPWPRLSGRLGWEVDRMMRTFYSNCPAAVQNVDLPHPISEWDHIPLRQLSKSPSVSNKFSSSSSNSSTSHHLGNLQDIISTGNCGLTIELGKVQDQLHNITKLMTTMSSKIQGLRIVVRQQREEIRALKTDDSYTRFWRRRPYARTYSITQIPQTLTRNWTFVKVHSMYILFWLDCVKYCLFWISNDFF